MLRDIPILQKLRAEERERRTPIRPVYEWNMQTRIYIRFGVTQCFSRSVEEYRASIPVIPESLVKYDPLLPYLVLVDPRIPPDFLCDRTYITRSIRCDLLFSVTEHAAPYWIRCGDGSRFVPHTWKECEQLLLPGERGATFQEGLAIHLQSAQLHEKNMTFPGSPSRFNPEYAASIRRREHSAEFELSAVCVAHRPVKHLITVRTE
jgi:hypothetical protein